MNVLTEHLTSLMHFGADNLLHTALQVRESVDTPDVFHLRVDDQRARLVFSPRKQVISDIFQAILEENEY